MMRLKYIINFHQNDILLLPIPKNHCLNILGYYLVN